tara:strand:- start:509 stop:1294 length:786 start_codon:yes stop_codon:yes gene_type:complete
MIIDSHCHLLHSKSEKMIPDIISDAKLNDVQAILNISTHPDEFDRIIDVSNQYKNIYSSIGIHPHSASLINDENYKLMNQLVKNPKVVGVGETGLDFYYNNSEMSDQLENLEKHIDIAQENNLPIIIHMREAEDAMSEILEKRFKQKEFKGVIHCFSGTERFANFVKSLNFYISISGIITFPKAQELRDVVVKYPLDKILVETDAPFLAPVPMRGRTNEPAFIKHTVEYLAKMFDLNIKDFSNKTSKNFLRLFTKTKLWIS